MSDVNDEELDLYAKAAHAVVDSVIDSAIKRLQTEDLQRQQALDSTTLNPTQDRQFVYHEPNLEEFEVQNIKWLMTGEFTPEKAKDKIDEFVRVTYLREYILKLISLIVDFFCQIN